MHEQSDKTPSTFWRKFFSNSGLILLAVLAVGVWFLNFRPYLVPEPHNPADFNQVTASPSPSPTENYTSIFELKGTPGPRKPVEKTLGPAPSPTLESLPTNEFLRRAGINANPTVQDCMEFLERYKEGPTARCRDGSQSYAPTDKPGRRGACSQHGGVVQWFR